MLGLIGPNGSGKTTLFECLGGVLPLDAGSLTKDGRPLTDRERASTLFYLPDAIVPWPAQSVRWAIDFTLGLFGGRAYLRNEVVERFGLDPLLDAAIGSLSRPSPRREEAAEATISRRFSLRSLEPPPVAGGNAKSAKAAKPDRPFFFAGFAGFAFEPFGWLLKKEYRELVSSRAWWVLL